MCLIFLFLISCFAIKIEIFWREKAKRKLVEDTLNHYDYYSNDYYYIPMEIGDDAQTINFMLSLSYSMETVVIASNHTGNCSFDEYLDETTAGLSFTNY